MTRRQFFAAAVALLLGSVTAGKLSAYADIKSTWTPPISAMLLKEGDIITIERFFAADGTLQRFRIGKTYEQRTDMEKIA